MKINEINAFKQDLLHYNITLDNYMIFINYFSNLGMINMTKEMNEQFSIILEFLLNLLENNILEL